MKLYPSQIDFSESSVSDNYEEGPFFTTKNIDINSPALRVIELVSLPFNENLVPIKIKADEN